MGAEGHVEHAIPGGEVEVEVPVLWERWVGGCVGGWVWVDERSTMGAWVGGKGAYRDAREAAEGLEGVNGGQGGQEGKAGGEDEGVWGEEGLLGVVEGGEEGFGEGLVA